MKLFVLDHKSPTCLIQWSDVFKNRLQTNISEMEGDSAHCYAIKDLGFARHRYLWICIDVPSLHVIWLVTLICDVERNCWEGIRL